MRRTKVADVLYIHFHQEQQSVVVIYRYNCTSIYNNNNNNNRNHKTWLLRINSSRPQAEQAKGADGISSQQQQVHCSRFIRTIWFCYTVRGPW